MNQLRAKVETIRRNLQGEAGQGLAEYAMILALIAVICIGGLTQLGIAVSDTAGFVTLPDAF